jgi:tetratricopeptide (TPR) repeat protein
MMLLGLSFALPAMTSAQSSSSSSSSTPRQEQTPTDDHVNPALRPRAARIEAGGAAVTLETSEPLFQIAAALNACGYDAGLESSAPVRVKVREEMDHALAASESGRDSRDKLCAYIRLHRQNDSGLDIGQYVSLALYLSPPPELTPNLDETQLPPQAAAVINVLPLLRTFAEEIQLHYIWLQHRAEYEALTARVHDPMEKMIETTNLYLHQRVSGYDGRRFLVLLEPMLSPRLTNARIYGIDYIIVMSPDNSTGVPLSMDQIRHIYLHYVVEPQVYSRGQAMERMQPLLRGVQYAPLEFSYKSDIVALITECLIKAIEAHMLVPDAPEPKKPAGNSSRAEFERYDVQKTAYDSRAAVARDALVTLDERQGWVLTKYFYDGLAVMGRNGDGLRDEMAPMIYGMDLDRERHHAEQILFLKDAPADPLRPQPQPRKIEGMDLAELDLMKGESGDAADIAEKALADPNGDHARATYVLARVNLMEGDPEKATQGFEQTLRLSKDPRTLAWSHIYLGRLYDTQDPPVRDKAVAEYKAALATRDSLPDTKQAAERGLVSPFSLPQRTRPKEADDKDFDPTGKAEKDAYKPPQ